MKKRSSNIVGMVLFACLCGATLLVGSPRITERPRTDRPAATRAEAEPAKTPPPVNRARRTEAGKRMQAERHRVIGSLSLDGVPQLPERIRQRARQYLAARQTRFVDWGPGGETMLVQTRFGNTVQIHRLSQPMGMREQLTFFDEPVASASFVRRADRSLDQRSIVLLMDRGGAESHQIYWRDLDSGRTRLLTDGKAKHSVYRWSRSGLLAFNGTGRNGRDFDIYLKRPGADQRPELILQCQGLWMPADFSADGERLLLRQYVSVNESYLHLLDLQTRRVASLIPPVPDRKVSYPAARFAPDGRSVYLTSDREGEFVRLYRYDLAQRELAALTPELRWDVESIEVSPDGRLVALSVNEDGLSRLRLYDRRSGKLRALDHPPGVVADLRFAPDGKLGFTLVQATEPANAFSYNPRRGALTRWTRGEVGGLDTRRFVAPRLVRFETFDHADDAPRQLSAYYYRPTGDGPHPVVIAIHGGPESQYRPYFRPLTQYMLREMGIAVVAPNVRGSRGYGRSFLLLDNGRRREDSVKDIGALLDWIGRQPELDARRVAVHGGSYGGYMVLASLVRFNRRLRAGIDWVGISNFVTFLENTRNYRRDLRRAEYGDERDPQMRRFLQRISPLTQAAQIRAPLLVIQGANDPRVPRSESEQLVAAVRAGGQPVWYLLAHDEGHGFRKQRNRQTAQYHTISFLERFLLDRDATESR